jgi:hypothetical protein
MHKFTNAQINTLSWIYLVSPEIPTRLTRCPNIKRFLDLGLVETRGARLIFAVKAAPYLHVFDFSRYFQYAVNNVETLPRQIEDHPGVVLDGVPAEGDSYETWDAYHLGIALKAIGVKYMYIDTDNICVRLPTPGEDDSLLRKIRAVVDPIAKKHTAILAGAGDIPEGMQRINLDILPEA